MVHLYVGNTDDSWYDFLASERDVDKVNFWQPSERNFSAIQAGELLAFRLKSPRNRIGGFGILTNVSSLPLLTAWEAFGRKNGTQSFEELRRTIASYRSDATVGPATNVLCRILAEPVFFPPELQFPVPESWARNIVSGRVYSTEEPVGVELWNRLLQAAELVRASLGYNPGFAEESLPRYGVPTLVVPRLGQGAFRVAVTEAYGRQCALSGGKVLPALDAAHIRPYAEGGSHTKTNGILLRKDIHSVFDSGYATVDADYRFVVSDKVKEVFDNGNEYRRLHGKALRLPGSRGDWPSLDALDWHNRNCFLG